MPPALELSLEQSVLGATRDTVRSWLANVDQPGLDLDRLAQEVGRLASSHARDRHDFRAAMLQGVRRVTEQTPREEIDRINRFYQQVADVRIGICEMLLDFAEKLEEKGHKVEGVAELREAIADHRRWKEDLLDELLLRHGPVRQRLAVAVREGLQNPPTASNWQELLDE